MKIIMVVTLVISSFTLSAQNKHKVGVILREHPYILTVEKLFDCIRKADTGVMNQFYADTAKFYTNTELPFEKTYFNLIQEIKNWKSIYREWDSISIRMIGKPEAFSYFQGGLRVQSIWEISGRNQKTNKTATYVELVLIEFNRDGKITKETSFLDSNQLLGAMN